MRRTGLLRVAIGAEVDRDLRDRRIVERADQQRRRRGVLAQRKADQIDPGLAGHADVAEQQVHRVVREHVEGIARAADVVHVIAGA